MLLVPILYSVTIYAAVSADFLIIVIFLCPIVLIGKTIFPKTNFFCVTSLTAKVTSYRSNKIQVVTNTNIINNTVNIGNQSITNQLMFLLYHQRKNIQYRRNEFHQEDVRLDVVILFIKPTKKLCCLIFKLSLVDKSHNNTITRAI